MILSISKAAMPCPFGGNSLTVQPRKAVLSVPDGRREIGRERQLAELRVERCPTGHRAWHGDAIDPAVRHLAFDPLALEEFGRHALGRPTARVQTVELVLLRHVD